jgi:hypothetical protein
MEVHKDHAARKRGDGIGKAVLHGPFVGGLETQARDGANVALNDMGEEWVGHLRLVGKVRGLVCHAQPLCTPSLACAAYRRRVAYAASRPGVYSGSPQALVYATMTLVLCSQHTILPAWA